ATGDVVVTKGAPVRTPIAALALLTVLAVAGCAADPTSSGDDSTNDPAAIATESSALLELECGALMVGADLVAAFGAEVPERAPYVEGWGGFFSVTTVALELAGATRCSWGDGNGADDRYLDVELLPHAVDDFARFESDLRLFQPIEVAGGGWSSCARESTEG